MAISVGLAALQSLAVVGLTSATWTTSVESTSSGLQIMLLDLDTLGVTCISGRGPLARYLIGLPSSRLLCYGCSSSGPPLPWFRGMAGWAGACDRGRCPSQPTPPDLDFNWASAPWQPLLWSHSCASYTPAELIPWPLTPILSVGRDGTSLWECLALASSLSSCLASPSCALLPLGTCQSGLLENKEPGCRVFASSWRISGLMLIGSYSSSFSVALALPWQSPWEQAPHQCRPRWQFWCWSSMACYRHCGSHGRCQWSTWQICWWMPALSFWSPNPSRPTLIWKPNLLRYSRFAFSGSWAANVALDEVLSRGSCSSMFTAVLLIAVSLASGLIPCLPGHKHLSVRSSRADWIGPLWAFGWLACLGLYFLAFGFLVWPLSLLWFLVFFVASFPRFFFLLWLLASFAAFVWNVYPGFADSWLCWPCWLFWLSGCCFRLSACGSWAAQEDVLS